MNNDHIVAGGLVLFFACVTMLPVAVLLAVALSIHLRRGLTYSTVLVCNTCVAISFYVINSSISVLYALPDRLCGFRGYLSYSAGASVYHSHVIQTVLRYCQIKRINMFDSFRPRLLLVVGQWTLSCTVALPILLTGQLSTPISDFICLLSMRNVALQLYICVAIFAISLATIGILYRRLIAHIRQSSLVSGNRASTSRDLTVIFRIVCLLSAMAILSIPFLVFLVISSVNVNSVPTYYRYITTVFISFSLVMEMMALIWLTQPIKQALVELLCSRRDDDDDYHVQPVAVA